MFYMMPPNFNSNNPDAVSQAERLMKLMERIQTKELKKKLKKEEEDKKKKEEEDKKKKAQQSTVRNFTPLEWFLLLLLSYPIIGPWYISLIKSIH